MDRRDNEAGPRRRAEADTGEISHRLAALEREIEEHRKWLREDPLLHRHTGEAA